MTPDEQMQRNMQFIIEHQAKFAANIEVLQEQQEALTLKIDKLAESQQRSEQRQTGTDTRLERDERILKLMVHAGRRERQMRREQDERIGALIDSTERNSQAIRELAGIVREIAQKSNGSGHVQS